MKKQKYQSTKTNPALTQVLQCAHKDIKELLDLYFIYYKIKTWKYNKDSDKTLIVENYNI